MKIISRQSVLGLLLLVFVAGAEPQLVKDSAFQLAPQMKDGPDVENHGGAWVWHVPAGKTGIPDWEVTGALQLWQMKRNNRRILDLRGGKGSIRQTIATTPGKWYLLIIRSSTNAEGGKNQTLQAAFNGQVRSLAGDQLGYQTVKFQAKGPATTLSFTGSTKDSAGGGPLLCQVQCVEFDPEVEKIQGLFDDLYREMDRGEKEERDISKLLSHLSDDFAYKPLEGSTLDKAGFEELVRRRIEKKFKVHTAIEEITRNEDGTITVEVERRQQEPGDYGTVKASAPHFKQTWVKAGASWVLKSFEEVSDSQ